MHIKPGVFIGLHEPNPLTTSLTARSRPRIPIRGSPHGYYDDSDFRGLVK